MELRELANNEASAFIERLIAAAEARAQNARAEAEQQVAAMRAEVDALRAELEAEVTRAAAFEADLDSVIEAHREVDAERQAAETARGQEAAARARAEEELRGIRERLERARAEASRVSEALEDEAAEKALLQEEVEGVRLTLTGLEKSYEAAEKKIATLERRVSELSQIESSLRGQLENMAAHAKAVEAESAAAARALRDRHDSDMRAVRSEAEALVTERDAARADLDMVRTDADMLRGELAGMRETAESARRQAEALASERDAARGEAQSLKTQCERLQSETQRLNAEATAARTDRDGLRAEVEAVRGQAQSARADADSWRSQEQTLRAEAQLSRDEAQLLRLEVDKSRAESEKLRAETERLRAEAATLSQASASNDELKTLQEMLDASREHHERQVAAAKELEAKLRLAEGRLQGSEADTASTLASSVRAIDALGAATTISELFGTVVSELATELPRVAVFRVKGNHLEGEHASGFDEAVQVRKIVIPMNVDSVLTRAAQGGGMVRAEGDDLAGSRLPFGGTPASAIAIPVSFQNEVLAVLYTDSPTQTTNAHATFALLVVRHATVLLSRLTQELKLLKELRDYAALLLQEAEQMFIADVESGRAAHDSIRRLRDTVDCGRQLYAQRAALEGTAAAALFDEQISLVINAQASAFSEALAAATQDHKRAAS